MEFVGNKGIGDIERWPTAAILAVATLMLGACVSSSVTSGPYWEDQKWNESLFYTLQHALHYPLGANAQSIDPVYGKVQFTYENGYLENLNISESTGSPQLDAAMLKQVSEARVALASGPDASVPHRYEFRLRMPTPISDFFDEVRTAIRKNVRYPRGAVIWNHQGAVIVSFDYKEGVVSDVQVAKTSGYKELDESAVNAVAGIKVMPPVEHTHERLHMQVQTCYSLGKQGTETCPSYKEVIQVINLP